MKNPKTSNPFDLLCNKSLTTEEQSEMRFKLVNYIELLIELDKQNKEWLKQPTETDDINKLPRYLSVACGENKEVD